jgi:hypothetical protein
MSGNSSPKKNSLTSSDEYDQLADLYREAYKSQKQSDEDYLKKFGDID